MARPAYFPCSGGRVLNHVWNVTFRVLDAGSLRLVASGFLSQIKHKHAVLGGEVGGLNRSKLVGRRVPSAALREVARPTPSRARGHVLHMAQSLRVAAAERGRKLTKEETRAVRRAACDEFRRMTDAEKAALSERALNQARTV